ncbi:unnamed protein product [Adineta steineri]|uniref:NAD-dependent epimerase/dehydratase domain-containing protein n=1 Tax=Adineta steineri TaxID=433720 RepID=A0A813ZL66_9BILA|nr:unnamed protein product [Adineta steineri]CAF3571936.1 unnamed protein product [Adineta steineri]
MSSDTESPKRKIVITGGAGFIGSQLGSELHRRGHEVILLDNMSFGHLDNLIVDGKTFGQLVVKDIRDPDLKTVFTGAHTVFHFAGVAALPVCQSEPQYAYDVNVSGTANVLEAARLSGVSRVIFSSTSAVYENNTHEVDTYKETDSIQPDLIYSMTKAASEDVCKAYSKNYNMDIIICRFFNVYGPHQDFRRKSPPFTSYVARELALDRQPTLFNQTDAKRDYIYSSDLISLMLKMWASTDAFHAEIFNISTGMGWSVPELYSKLCTIADKNISANYKDPTLFWDKYKTLTDAPYSLDPNRITKEVHKNCVGDATKARKTFNWEPQVTIDRGLFEVYKYTQDHSNCID